LHAAFEDTADNALLFPGLTRFQFSIRI